MSKIFISPSKYVQSYGEIKKLSEYLVNYGKKGMILITESGFKRLEESIKGIINDSDVKVIIEYFRGECSKDEINRITSVLKAQNCEFIVGIGGGKTLDTAKAAAFYKKIPVIICPTSASTDAPCSALSVLYKEDGTTDEFLFYRTNPNLVLVDTKIICNSPLRLTVSGFGDALATYYEARACFKSGALSPAGGQATIAAMALAKACLDTLLEEGVKAKLALETRSCTKAVENVIEANTLLSGIGFESAGTAAAHAIQNGLNALDECHSMYHGEKVAFGTIVQLVMENESVETIEKIIKFCIDVGLPVTLKELGINDITEEKLMVVAKNACDKKESIHNMPFSVTEEDVCAAIKAADNYGKSIMGKMTI